MQIKTAQERREDLLKGTGKKRGVSKHQPHHGARERARRVRQMERLAAKKQAA